jgi:rhomboid protease GluP
MNIVSPPPAPLLRRPDPAVLAVLILCCLIEALLQAADAGLIGASRWRALAYENAGFWAGLLWGWTPNYAAQPVLMFFSYSALHSGLSHLAGNMLPLWILGNIVTARIGQRGFLGLWLLATLAGALAFGLITESPRPMVGTSGALFGLAGAWMAWEARDRRSAGQSRLPVLGWLVALVVLNLAYFRLQHGLLAWETHLGGFLAGGAWGLLDKGPPAVPNTRP